MNTFDIKYRKEGNPTSTRTLSITTPWSYKTMIYEHVFPLISNTLYNDDFFEIFDRYMDLQRGVCNNNYCEYIVVCKDLNDIKKVLCKYEIEINCTDNPTNMDLLELD